MAPWIKQFAVVFSDLRSCHALAEARSVQQAAASRGGVELCLLPSDPIHLPRGDRAARAPGPEQQKVPEDAHK